jgi:hypothetical protein
MSNAAVALGAARCDAVNARYGCSIFNVTAAFVELTADKINLLRR